MKKKNCVRTITLFVVVSILVTMLGGCAVLNAYFQGKTNGASATLEGTVVCYAEPDVTSDILATFHNGLQVNYDEIITIQGLQWIKSEHGWVVISGEEGTEEAAPREAFIRAKLLNVRVAPGESSEQVAQLPKGTFVNVYEVAEAEDGRWARVDQGWVYLKHVYFPGEEGNNTGFAVVRDNGAKVSTRILESGETVEKLKAGKRVAFLEKLELKDGAVWIYANDGWIRGEDVYIEGEEGKRPCTGIVVDSTPLNVRQGPGTNYEIITSLPYGTYVEVIERINRGEYDWGFIGNGWIYMKNVDTENAGIEGVWQDLEYEYLDEEYQGAYHFGTWEFRKDGTFTFQRTGTDLYKWPISGEGEVKKDEKQSGSGIHTFQGTYSYNNNHLVLTYTSTDDPWPRTMPFKEDTVIEKNSKYIELSRCNGSLHNGRRVITLYKGTRITDAIRSGRVQ